VPRHSRVENPGTGFTNKMGLLVGENLGKRVRVCCHWSSVGSFKFFGYPRVSVGVDNVLVVIFINLLEKVIGVKDYRW